MNIVFLLNIIMQLSVCHHVVTKGHVLDLTHATVLEGGLVPFARIVSAQTICLLSVISENIPS